MSEDSSFNGNRKKEEEHSVAPDFYGSLGKGMLAKEKIETLGNSSGLTPIGLGVNVRNRIVDRENNETPNYSSGLSPFRPSGEIYGIKKKSLSSDEGFSADEGLGTLGSSSGLSPLNFDSERRCSPLRTPRTQSPVITNFALKESELND